MQIYNTLSRKKEELVPLEGNTVRIYACGPTVYNYIHIGNARPLCVFDTLRRYLEYAGYEVKFVQNFTDVDDKLIKKANEEGITVPEVAERYIAEYWKDADGMNVRRATVHPRATENIDGILDIIKTLVDKGYAYATENGDVYFRARKFKEYGKLSHQPIDDLESGARISVGEEKEDPLDFALWKGAKPGEPMWDSPWGKGRPGWHIECSAMSRRYLGDTFDIHCGGQDLIFPHHENEIAQSECCTGKPFAHFWMHNGYLNIDNRKMSKSLGNFFTVREISEKYGYEAIRYLMLSAQYRSPINFSQEVIESCVSSLERMYTCRDNLDFAIANAQGDADDLRVLCDQRRTEFRLAMDDDLNTADAISAVFELVRDINSAKEQSRRTLEYAASVFDELTGVLGLVYNRKKSDVPQDIVDMANERAAARKAKDFARADALRDAIAQRGYLLEDTAEGPKITKK
ncbi:MAG: cysteine--tRNA ligase [Oscillospiraceae bacterium]|nr:cysteine--tRNA ligase [Oscillospiraceae bacterium]